MLIINRNTKILGNIENKSVVKAVENLKRDIDNVCSSSSKNANDIYLEKIPMADEQFSIIVENENLKVRANDTLGFVYGIYEISKTILGIQPFWFWNDQIFDKKEEILVPQNFAYNSVPCKVKYRGWFINDEVLLHKWNVDCTASKPWEMAFEALLRCRGNMVIPGTDKNSKIYASMASDMGLYITHHHAEPLGAQMFARAYPELNPSYAEHKEKFQQLWKDGIQAQKNMNVIWNLGFRGQGDCPFWDNDPQYKTPQSRGELMSTLIKKQYDLVKEVLPNAICCTNLYGETMELYRDGYLKLPEDVIKIWADNGYGKMVTRRQGNHNPRIKALPNDDDNGRHGIYYHVSFYDLQAANHVTMLPNSADFIEKELMSVLKHGIDDYWIINCSNVKPHVYFLSLIAKMWQEGNVDVKEQRMDYINRYYGKDNAMQIADLFEAYADTALQYGVNEDDHAGEQFVNHVPRILIHQYLKNKDTLAEDLLWATQSKSLQGQIDWYYELCLKAQDSYEGFIRKCEQLDAVLENHSCTLFRDSLYLHGQIYYYCYQGAVFVCRSLSAALAGDYQKAFYYAGKARKKYLQADKFMRDREHGKWHDFYANECLTDIKQTAWVLEYLMGYVRNLSDGPHFFEWQRDFLYSKEDRRVLLIYNMENHLKDQELFTLMEAKWDK